MKMNFTPPLLKITYFQPVTLSALFFCLTSAMYPQGNSGNNNGNGNGNGKPVVGGIGPIANPNLWSQNGNSASASSFLGTLNNFPLLIKVNNVQRASFTNSGLAVYGNLNSTSATIDSILTAWQVQVADVLQAGSIVTTSIDAGQYLLNGVPVDFSAIQAIDSIQDQINNIQLNQWQSTGGNNITYDGSLTVTGNVEADSLTVSNINSDTIYVHRVMPANGDSLIHFGASSVNMNNAWNCLYGTATPNPYFGTVNGIGLGDMPIANAVGSVAIGLATKVEPNASRAIVIGSGIFNSIYNFSFLRNNLPNTLMVGFNSDIPTLTVRESNGAGTTGNIGIGTSNPRTTLEVTKVNTDINNAKFNINSHGIAISSTHATGAHLPGLIWYTSQNLANPKAGIWTSIDPGERGSYLHFATSNAYNQGMNQIGMTINYEGNVGIGTTSPGDKFIVYQPTAAATAGKRGLVVGDTLAKSFSIIPNATGNTANGTVWSQLIKEEDIALIYRNATFNSGNAGLVIAPHKNSMTGMRMDAEGNIGVGISPLATLNIFEDESTDLVNFIKDISKKGILITSHYSPPAPGQNDIYLPGVFWSNNNISTTIPKAGIWVRQNGGTDLILGTSNDYAEGINSQVIINRNGNVGIGVSEPQHKLEVNGTIRAIEWIIEPDGWNDIAFTPGYQKMHWKKKKQIYEQQGFLPYMDAGTEIETAGLKVARNMKGMMLNIEEDRLDITELFERLELLEEENKALKERMISLMKLLESTKN